LGPTGFRLGVQVRPVTDADVSAYRLSAAKGLVVVGVEKGGMADAMEIQKGDILLEVNGVQIADVEAFGQLIRSGGAKTFRVLHNGQSVVLFIPLSL
jgi:S1-C subfamily serine protease